MSFSMKLTGVAEAQSLLKQLRKSVPENVIKATVTAGTQMQTEARDLAPVDTGSLVKSIQFRMSSATSALVETGVGYAGFLEFGTRKMRAQPFWTPAFAITIKAYEAALRKALKAA